VGKKAAVFRIKKVDLLWICMLAELKAMLRTEGRLRFMEFMIDL